MDRRLEIENLLAKLKELQNVSFKSKYHLAEIAKIQQKIKAKETELKDKTMRAYQEVKRPQSEINIRIKKFFFVTENGKPKVTFFKGYWKEKGILFWSLIVILSPIIVLVAPLIFLRVAPRYIALYIINRKKLRR